MEKKEKKKAKDFRVCTVTVGVSGEYWQDWYIRRIDFKNSRGI